MTMPHLNKKISWDTAMFTAEHLQEPMVDVHIRSAKVDFVEKAYDLASTVCPSLTDGALTIIANKMMSLGRVQTQERVEIDGANIVIVINTNDVNDDLSTWRALDMLATALDHLDGSSGVVPFGEPVTYKLSDLQWIMCH